MEDIHISQEALALFTGILSAVIGALIALFWLGWKERDQRISDLHKLNDDLMERQASRLQEILAAVREVKLLVERLVGRGP